MKFRLFGPRGNRPRKPVHKPSRQVRPNTAEPDVSAPNYQPPTVHSTRHREYLRQLHQADQVSQDLRRYYRYHAPTQEGRDAIGAEVEEAMRQQPHDPHDALTDEVRIVRRSFDPHKTQPLE